MTTENGTSLIARAMTAHAPIQQRRAEVHRERERRAKAERSQIQERPVPNPGVTQAFARGLPVLLFDEKRGTQIVRSWDEYQAAKGGTA